MKRTVVNFLVMVSAVMIGLAAYGRYHQKQYMQAAFVAQGLQAASMSKALVATFYETHGRWPSSNDEAGLPPPDRFAGQVLKDMSVGEGGAIRLRYNASSGIDNGIITFIPEPGDPGLGVQWQCVTSSYEDIATYVPQCRFDG